MTMLDDVLGAAVPGAKNRICTLWRRREGKRGSGPSSTGAFVGNCLIAALICAGTAPMMSDTASAKARKGGAKASDVPTLDAQSIDAAQLPAASGKGRAARVEATGHPAPFRSSSLFSRAAGLSLAAAHARRRARASRPSSKRPGADHDNAR